MTGQPSARDRRKSHNRKLSYPTLERAEEAANKVNDRLALVFSPIVAYPCRYCPAFHIGHREPIER